MNTCFLFAETLSSEEQCIVVRLNEQGELVNIPQMEALNTLSLENDTRFILVLPSRLASIHQMTLPNISLKKHRATLPFLMEDIVISDPEDVYFGLDLTEAAEEKKTVFVIEKEILDATLMPFLTHHIHLHAITIDWYALNHQEAFKTPEGWVVHTDTANGDLSALLFPLLSESPNILPLVLDNPSSEQYQFTFIAKRLWNGRYLNLIELSMPLYQRQNTHKRYGIIASVAVILFLSNYFLTHFMTIQSLKNQNLLLDKQINTIYQAYFPGATQIISPKFRLTQWVKNNTGANNDRIWALFNGLNKHITTAITINNAEYQNDQMKLTLKTDSLNTLTAFRNNLIKDNIKVTAVNTINRNNQVNATWILK